MHLKRYMHPNAQNSIIYNWQDNESKLSVHQQVNG